MDGFVSAFGRYHDAYLEYSTGYGEGPPDLPGLEARMTLTPILREIVLEDHVFDAIGLLAGVYDVDFITVERAPEIARRLEALADGASKYLWPRPANYAGPGRAAGTAYAPSIISEMHRLAQFIRDGVPYKLGTHVIL